MHARRQLSLQTAIFSLLLPAVVALGDNDDDDRKPSTSTAVQSGDFRFGAFGLLDTRSKYNGDWYPEPFRVEDTTVNDELRFDWNHSHASGLVSNSYSAEIQKSAGLVTLEIRGAYIHGAPSLFAGNEMDPVSEEGLANVELGARLPLHQFVSTSGVFDNTVGVNMEVGVPTNSRVSKNTEIGPGIFDDLRIGDHFSLQSLFTLSSLFGSRPEEGRDSFEYGLAFGYVIEDEELAIPFVERSVPIFELVGETTLDGNQGGHNSLTGTAGVRLELKKIDHIQPQFGVGYLFPIDRGGREDLHWGIIVSLTLEF